MKWYKKQLDEKLKKDKTTDPTKTPPISKPAPKKVIKAGLEKRSRPKTDSIS